ncbi:hypothetical protein PG989_011726 [Apiospora arundinis]
MQLLTLIAPLLFCIGPITAMNISAILEGLPDGGYIRNRIDPLLHITNLEGKPIVGSPFLIDNKSRPTASPIPTANGTYNQTDTWGCIEGEQIDQETWWKTWSGLSTWCDAGNVLDQQAVYSWHYNGTVAYICNQPGRLSNCLGPAYLSYMEEIADVCGNLSPGRYYQASGDKAYGRGIAGGKSDPYEFC